MRILYVTHRFPYPPTFGSKVRAFHAIRHLGRAHQVTVLAPVRSAQEATEAVGIDEHCHAFRTFPVSGPVQLAKLCLSLPSRLTASEAYFHSFRMQREVERMLASRSFDFVFAHCSSVGRVVEGAEGMPKLLDLCDVDSRKWLDYVAYKPWPLSWGYRWEGMRLTAVELRLARRFDRVTVATAGELSELAKIGVIENADWFPNGVDVDYFCPGEASHDPQLITFVGRMDYFPNVQCMIDFCADVWPRLRSSRRELRLQIVGAAPVPAVRRLARLPGVSVTGAVPDVRPYVRNSALTIAPLTIARGTQNKILESMAMGVPVVCSSAAASGVDAEPGVHLRVATGPAQWQAEIEEIVGSTVVRSRFAEAGRTRVTTHHGWTQAMARMDHIVDACLRTQVGGSLLSAH